MTLPAIYISLYLLTIVLFFMKTDRALSYKNSLIGLHFLLLILFLVNFRGVWVDKLIGISFLLTASATFALYRRTLRLWQKIYFGLFAFYPVIAASTFLMDRLMFAIVASPFLAILTIPETRFSDSNYAVREQFGVIAPIRLQLIKKGFVTESILGSTNEENVISSDISALILESQTKDTTIAVITSKDKTVRATFTK